MKKSFIASQIYAFITVALWSTAYVFTKIALIHFSASSLGLLRCGIASLCLLPVVLARGFKPPARGQIIWFLLSGATGFSLYLITFNLGSATLNGTTSSVIIATSPIISALLALLVFRERLNAPQWLATVFAFGGVLVMFLLDGTFFFTGGLAWMLAAAVLISIYNILQRKLSRHFSALEITAYSFCPGTLFLMIFLPEAAEQLQSASAYQAGLVCFLGIFPSAIAYLSWGKALAVAPKTSNVTNFMFLTPFLALMLEYAVTGALPGRGTFIGGGIILASLFVFVAVKGK